MRIALLADGRSPITQGWLRTLNGLGYQVHLLSTFPCIVEQPLASYHLVPIAFSGMVRQKQRSAQMAPGGAGAIRLRATARRWLGIATFPAAIQRMRAILTGLDVDLLHALRIPYEGMLAAESKPAIPLILSVWGNDFTLHARSAPWMQWLTRRSVARTDGIHADCHRDIRLARGWGLKEDSPTLVVPGGGGLDRKLFHVGSVDQQHLRPEIRAQIQSLPEDTPVVINPRGFRAYVRNDTFFHSLPLILREFPSTKFLAPTMLGERSAEQWLNRLGIEGSVILLPKLTPEEMAILNRRSQVMVSPSEHDGTPNSFLEAIACGCFPVVGDLESLREWVQDGVNGLLIDPSRPEALAQAVIQALRDSALRSRASKHNQALIDDRAERARISRQLDRFYHEVLEQKTFQKPEQKGSLS